MVSGWCFIEKIILIIYSQEQYHSESFVPKDLIRINIIHLIREFSLGDFSSYLINIILISLIIIQSGLLVLRNPERMSKKLSKWVVILSGSWLWAILKIYKAALEFLLCSIISSYS